MDMERGGCGGARYRRRRGGQWRSSPARRAAVAPGLLLAWGKAAASPFALPSRPSSLRSAFPQDLRPVRGGPVAWPYSPYCAPVFPRYLRRIAYATLAILRPYTDGAATGFVTMLSPTTSTSTMSPSSSLPTPAEVPVAIRSPGSRVMIAEMYEMRNGMENAISAALPC